MTHGSLFSGIGGFDLAAEWMGWENKFHCEWNEFGKKVLSHYWPNAKSYDDIKKTDFTVWRGRIDVLTGGFPCQPYSTAGKRKGKEDDRHLWPEMLRAIREIQPIWVVGENVRGIVSWSRGLVFDEVQSDLEAEGYEVVPIILPACAVNAPHRRDRVWFIAYSDSHGHESRRSGENRSKEKKGEGEGHKRKRVWNDSWGNGESGTFTNTPSLGRVQDNWEGKPRFVNKESQKTNWQNFPTQPPVCGGNDGLPTELDGITFSKWRNESIKGFGNAIVPQVALEIFKVIDQMNEMTL
jgi:DNA (cytosine-5)-methyltransferase 1